MLYDHLVHPRLLRHARPDAEKIDVGVAAPQPLEQEAICYLLAEKAREGKVVARLKWGDPFVFDRGGAEALFLHEQGVRFEVVPGIPAGIGAASYAGIPLTYPGGGDTLTFVRGHEDEGKTRAVGRLGEPRAARRHDRLLRRTGSAAARCCSALLSHGRPAGRVRGAHLRRHAADAGDDARHARRARRRRSSESSDRRPAILVVGRVAALREHLRWFDARPLFGKRVLVTRPREQAAELVELLEALGAEAIEAPMIRIVPPDDYGPLDDGLRARSASSTGSSSPAPTPSTRSSSGCSATPRDLRALHGVQAVRGRAGDGRAAARATA